MNRKHDTGKILVFALILAVAGALGLAAGSWSLLRWGGAAAAVMATQNGEVLMRRAMVYEQAGEYASARDTYQNALQGKFAGKQNQIYTQKGLAVVSMKLGEEASARALFDELIDSPYWAVAWYKAYVPLLEEKERQTMAERWYRAAENGGHAEERRQALTILAHGYEATGDVEAAREAFATLATEKPYSEAAYHLGRLEWGRGERARAHRLMTQYLAGGGASATFGDQALAHIRTSEAMDEMGERD